MAQPAPPASTPGGSGLPREPHLLSLKVLRAARPSLVASSHPYYESTSLGASTLSQADSSSVDAHNNGEYGLTGTLVLPSSFGTIFLGATFSALLCLSNDTSVSTSNSPALSPVLKVEMHTTGTPPATGGLKHHLATIYAPTATDALAASESVEGLVSHEIKEVGLHALVCTVTYGVKIANGSTVSRSFRKVYKFQVSNPLSVRTKAHSASPLSATSTLSATERTKVFLEVQVQNLGENAMSFERMQFDPIPQWSVLDLNADQSLFTGEAALLGPGSVRQYIYILQTPKGMPNPPPGSSQPLGRLDIMWRTPHGEVGRLQTSMLGRRIPALAAPPAPVPVPEKPSFITPIPPTANSPSMIKTPAPYRPSHLSQSITDSTPLPPPPPAQIAASPLEPLSEGLEFDLVVDSVALGDSVSREKPFEVNFRVNVKDVSPRTKQRRIRIAAQFVQYHDNPLLPLSELTPLPLLTSVPTIVKPPPPAPTLSIPQPHQPQNSLLLPGPVASSNASRRSSMESARSGGTLTALGSAAAATPATSLQTAFKGIVLPPPTPSSTSLASMTPGAKLIVPSRDLLHLGPTVVELGRLTLSPPPESKEAEQSMPIEGEDVKFSATYVALESGLVRVGGVRIFLMESVTEGDELELTESRERKAKCVWERAVVAEVWVGSGGHGPEMVGR